MTTAAGSVAGAAGTAAGAAGSALGGAAAGSALSAGLGAVASKAVAGLAAVTLVTAGAVEVNKVTQRERVPVAATPTPVTPEPVAEAAAETTALADVEKPAIEVPDGKFNRPEQKPEPAPAPAAPVEEPAAEPVPAPEPVPPTPAAGVVDEGGSTTTLTPGAEEEPTVDSEDASPAARGGVGRPAGRAEHAARRAPLHA